MCNTTNRHLWGPSWQDARPSKSSALPVSLSVATEAVCRGCRQIPPGSGGWLRLPALCSHVHTRPPGPERSPTRNGLGFPPGAQAALQASAHASCMVPTHRRPHRHAPRGAGLVYAAGTASPRQRRPTAAQPSPNLLEAEPRRCQNPTPAEPLRRAGGTRAGTRGGALAEGRVRFPVSDQGPPR